MGIDSIGVNDARMRVGVRMLGDFAIVFGDSVISENCVRASKTWKLLQYLIIHRDKAVSKETLIELFCSGEGVSNPGGALRMLISRTRAILSESGLPNASEILQSKGGGYALSRDISLDVDAERFEALCKEADATADKERQLDLLLQAIDLYSGDFLPNSDGELWVMPLTRWYRSIFTGCVHKALGLLSEKDSNVEMEEICAKAMRIDPFEEKFIYYYLQSLLKQGKSDEAFRAYDDTESMFYEVLGVHLSQEINDLINAPPPVTNRTHTSRDGAPLDTTLNDWREDAAFSGAYYCNLNVFKSTYQIEARKIPRSNHQTFIVSINIKPGQGAETERIMKKLGVLISGALRKGDLYTRSEPNQYMLMLFNISHKGCEVVTNRIMRKLDAKHLPKITGSHITQVLPIQQDEAGPG